MGINYRQILSKNKYEKEFKLIEYGTIVTDQSFLKRYIERGKDVLFKQLMEERDFSKKDSKNQKFIKNLRTG